MPDYGDGFLAAALQHFSYNSEQVIHCLLEGILPPDLQGLDPKLPLQPPSQQPSRGTKGTAQPNGRFTSVHSTRRCDTVQLSSQQSVIRLSQACVALKKG